MNWKMVVPLFLLCVALLLPTKALAVDYKIQEATINAYVKEDGTVYVTEQLTYDFTGKFNGITRELIPKEGASIEDFSATENGQPLKSELDDYTYKIFRKGKNEEITIDLHYRILNGMEKYEDGVQFYWPFFDRRNESDYQQLTIHIHPPKVTNDVIFIGYDTAYKTGSLDNNGTVSYRMGRVSSGKNGDIRVVYDPALFPNLVENKGLIRDKVIAEANRMETEMLTFSENKATAYRYGLIGVIVLCSLFIATLVKMVMNSNKLRRVAREQLSDDKVIVPEEKLSLPATIFYTNGRQLTSEVTAAALLDLIRKGHIEQVSEEHFQLIDRNVTTVHEEALIELLFDKIGDGKTFYLEQLDAYTKNKKNHESYRSSIAIWRSGVSEEVKQKEFVKQNEKGIRWLQLLIGVSFVISIFTFVRYELFLFMGIAILLSILSILLAVFYRPRSLQGHIIVEEWKALRKKIANHDAKEWDRISADDKFRVYTYGVGVRDKYVEERFEEFAIAEKRVGYSNSYGRPLLITSSFQTANTNAAVDSGGSSSSGGGGVGGGGGGSGAF